MNKAYFLEDSTTETLPEVVTSLSQSNQTKILTPMDHLAFLLHCLMTECGFMSGEDDENIFKLCDSKAGIYRFKYFIPNDSEERKICTLVLTSVGPVVMAIGNCMNSKAATYRMENINASEFISNCTNPKFPGRFRNLRALSFKFKMKLAMPLLSLASQTLDLPPGTESMMCLPEEVHRMIIEKIDRASDVLHLGRTCKYLKELCDANEVWKNLFDKKFLKKRRDGAGPTTGDVANWKQEYRKSIIMSSTAARMASVRYYMNL